MFYCEGISKVNKKGDCTLKLFKFGCCALLLSLCCMNAFSENAVSVDFNQNEEELDDVRDEDVVESPAYDKLLPIIGWNRYSGDTAGTIEEWRRWWKYLLLEKSNGTKTVIMNWMNGLRLRIYPGNEVFRSIFVRGIYDPNLVVVINALLPTDGVFVDIGANMGYCSLLMSEKVGEDGKVFAIEPSERDFLRLVDNVSLNELSNVSVYRLAISDKSGNVKISIAPEERSSLNTLGTAFSNKGIEELRTEDVISTTLDKFVKQEEINKIDVIKMDIEGSEFKALKGARESIEKYRPALIVGVNKNSLNASGSSVEDIMSMLKALRYKVYYLNENPFFALKEANDLSLVGSNWIVCIHESFVPPILPQPKKVKFLEKIRDFFAK